MRREGGWIPVFTGMTGRAKGFTAEVAGSAEVVTEQVRGNDGLGVGFWGRGRATTRVAPTGGLMEGQEELAYGHWAVRQNLEDGWRRLCGQNYRCRQSFDMGDLGYGV